MIDGEKGFTVRNPLHPCTEEQRMALHDHVSSLLPEDGVAVYTHKKERFLAVTDRLDGANHTTLPVPWSDRTVGDYAVLLEGDEHQYCIVGTKRPDVDPTLVWPRNRGVGVYGVAVQERESELHAEERAADLFRQVGIHNGQ